MKAETRLPYTAGFIEADGCFSITNSGIMIRVTNVHVATLERFKSWYGGTICKHGGGDKYFNWHLYGVSAANLCKELLPFLDMKRRQAELLITFQDTVGPRGKLLSEHTLQQRAYILEALSESRTY